MKNYFQSLFQLFKNDYPDYVSCFDFHLKSAITYHVLAEFFCAILRFGMILE